jgi:hypothetical protein
MIKVLVESPYSGDIERNERYARAALKDCFERGEAPFASHLLYTQPLVLNDLIEEERKKGISAGLLWGEGAAYTVVYVDLGVSKGMIAGIENALAKGRPVVYRKLSPWQCTCAYDEAKSVIDFFLSDLGRQSLK